MTHYQCPECDVEGKNPKDVKKNGCKCKVEPMSYLDPEDHKPKKSKKKKNKKQTELLKDERKASKILYDHAQTKILKIAVSQNNIEEVYAIVRTNNHIETINLSVARAKYWLSNEHAKFPDYNELHSDEFYKTILNAIISKAQMNETNKQTIYNRIAHFDNEIWYDLGNSKWQAIKIQAEKIRTVSLNEDSPIFRRPRSLYKQVMPKKGDRKALDKLAELLHIVVQERLVFIVHLIELFLQDCPIPMIVFDGSSGSLKTTATFAIKVIVDPNGQQKEDNVSMIAEKQDDLIVQLNNRYVSSFDNVSYIDSKTSDVLCRAITGSSNPKRKLYTDDDEVIHNFRSKIVLNGIIPTLEYPDLQSRLIIYDRETIDETNRITEKEFNEKFNKLLPYILGQIFLTLQKALALYPKLKNEIKPKTRMSDFELWGEIISRCLGHKDNKFLKSYHDKLNQAHISAKDSYPIIESMQFFMRDKKTCLDSASNIYAKLSEIAQEELKINLKERFVKFPKNANQITKHLKLVQPYLKSAGLIVESFHWTKQNPIFTKNSSVIKIIKIDEQTELSDNLEKKPSLPSLPSLEKNQAQKSPKNSEGSSEGNQTQDSKPSLKKTDSTNENQTSESSEGSEGTNSKFYVCYTCNEKGTEPIPVNSKTPNRLTVEMHIKAGHSVKFLTAKEAKLERDSQSSNGLN